MSAAGLVADVVADGGGELSAQVKYYGSFKHKGSRVIRWDNLHSPGSWQSDLGPVGYCRNLDW